MLVRMGPFRFHVPTYSVEKITRSVKSRVASQDVIESLLLGPAGQILAGRRPGR